MTKGRRFELFVKALEEVCLDSSSVLESPGYLLDKLTQVKREIDILIHTKVGNNNLKIAFECRHRNSKPDVTWIEQMVTKYQHLDVDKLIAVSENGFSEPAKVKASFHNIETRILDDLDVNAIKDIWPISHVNVLSNQFEIKFCQLVPYEKSSLQVVMTNKDKLIYESGSNKFFCLDEIFQLASQQLSLWDSILPGQSILKEVNVGLVESETQFFIKGVRLGKIRFLVELKTVATKEPISRVQQYSNGENTISHLIEYKNVVPGKNVNMQLILEKSGNANVRLSDEG